MLKRALSYAPSLLLLLALPLSGCAAKVKPPILPYHDDPKNSYALNIMRARGAKVIQDSKPDSAVGKGPSVIGMAVAGWAGAGSSSPASLGLGSIAGAGLNILALTSSSNAPAEAFGLGFGWVKKSDESMDAIVPRIKELAVKAFRETMEETPLPPGYSYEISQDRAAQAIISGPECGEKAECGYSLIFATRLIDTFLPDSLGSSEAWRYTISLPSASYVPKSSFKPYVAFFDDLGFYQRLSAKLPPETFIYLAPSYGSWAISMQTEQGVQFLREPLLLNKGEIHRFIDPRNNSGS